MYAFLSIGLLACEKPVTGPDLASARPLSDLPGRDPDDDEQAWLAERYTALALARGAQSSPPLVRIVTTEEHRELVARQQAAAPRLLEEQALQVLGLIDRETSLAELAVLAAPPAVWLPDKRVLTVLEQALGTAELEHALALSLDGTCTPAADTRDARLAAHAVHEGTATTTVLAALLAEREVALADAAIDGTVATQVLSERAAWLGAHPLVAAEHAWARERGTVVALRLHQSGAFRSLRKACDEPPGATYALAHPDAWKRSAELAPLGAPQVPSWTEEGWRDVGVDRLGTFTLTWWLRQLGADDELSEGWQGDAVRVYRKGSALRAAWSIQVAETQAAHLLRALIDGRTLRDGRSLQAHLSGTTVTVLAGAEGEPLLRTADVESGGGWAHGLRTAPTIADSAIGRRLASARATFKGGLLQLGALRTTLDDEWRPLGAGVHGEVVTLTNRSIRARVEVSLVPRVLAGAPETAVSQGVELARLQHGVDGVPRVRTTEDGAVARVDGSDKHGRPRLLEVHAWPREDDLLYVVALIQRDTTPRSYARLLQQLRAMDEAALDR